MRKLGLAFALFLLAANTFAQQSTQNLGFEVGSRGEVPKGWFFPSASAQGGYRAKLTDQNPRAGSLCAVIEFTGEGWGTSHRDVRRKTR